MCARLQCIICMYYVYILCVYYMCVRAVLCARLQCIICIHCMYIHRFTFFVYSMYIERFNSTSLHTYNNCYIIVICIYHMQI